MQSSEASVDLIVTRWRCGNSACPRQTFSGCPAELASAFAQRTRRVARLVRLLAYAAGGRPAERLTRQRGFPQSRDTLLRTLIQAERHQPSGPCVLGIGDWAWRTGHACGTIMGDLERREVIDVLRERSAAATARWLAERPGVEIVARDRCGLYAEGARLGAPAARHVADRFHLIQNLRQGIQQQFSRAPAVPSPFNPLEHAPVPSAPPGSVLARLNRGGGAVSSAVAGPRPGGSDSSRLRPSWRRGNRSRWSRDGPGWTAARSPNGAGSTLRRNGGARYLARPARTLSAIASRAAGPRDAHWGGSCSRRSERTDIRGPSLICTGFSAPGVTRTSPR